MLYVIVGNRDNVFTPKDYYDEAWHGRDFELTTLWQRSVFLAVFMLAIAAAYGAIAMKMLFPSSWFDTVNARQHIAAALVCYLGIAFSMLWIMMAKGSKYWSERYENTIYYISKNTYIAKNKRDILHRDGLSEPDTTSENLFSTAAYRFSPSRINIAIGIVCILAWAALNMAHAGMAFRDIFESHGNLSCALFGIGQCFIGVSILYFVLSHICKSGD